MYCSNCGTKLESAVNFCPNCGSKQGNIPPEDIEPNTPSSQKVCSVCNQRKRRIFIELTPSEKFVCVTHDLVKGLCPNCGSILRSEKAEQCHKCFASWRLSKPTGVEEQPTNYHSSSRPVKCPKCNSNQVSADRKGFGLKRALLGGAILGPVGLLAGATGRKKVEISCLKCGHRWNA